MKYISGNILRCLRHEFISVKFPHKFQGVLCICKSLLKIDKKMIFTVYDTKKTCIISCYGKTQHSFKCIYSSEAVDMLFRFYEFFTNIFTKWKILSVCSLHKPR